MIIAHFDTLVKNQLYQIRRAKIEFLLTFVCLNECFSFPLFVHFMVKLKYDAVN